VVQYLPSSIQGIRGGMRGGGGGEEEKGGGGRRYRCYVRKGKERGREFFSPF